MKSPEQTLAGGAFFALRSTRPAAPAETPASASAHAPSVASAPLDVTATAGAVGVTSAQLPTVSFAITDGAAGSIKKTGEAIEVKRKRRTFR